MMNSDQWYMCKIAEEASEVAHRALKAQQFGLGEVEPGQYIDNYTRLVNEFYDLMVVFDDFIGLVNNGTSLLPHEVFVRTKRKKLEKYLELSQKLKMVGHDS